MRSFGTTNYLFITIVGKSVFFRPWYEARVKYIKDLMSEDGNLLTFNEFRVNSVLKHTSCNI